MGACIVADALNMDVREKLVELIAKAKYICANDYSDHTEDEYIADTLLDNGVTVQECGYWVSLTDCAKQEFIVPYVTKRFTKRIMRGATEKISCVLTIAHIAAQR